MDSMGSEGRLKRRLPQCRLGDVVVTARHYHFLGQATKGPNFGNEARDFRVAVVLALYCDEPHAHLVRCGQARLATSDSNVK